MTTLSADQRSEMVRRWCEDGQTQKQIAIDFGMTQSAVSKVIARVEKTRGKLARRGRVRRVRPRVYLASQLGTRSFPFSLDLL